MIWPSPKDYHDAVRKPAAAFTDPDLAAADAVVGKDGRPESHPGESSTVYQLCAEDGRSWAVKCFARLNDTRAARFATVRAALGSAPFAVSFDYLENALRAGGKTWPVLKMDWVEGLPFNRVARERADSPAVLDRLFQQWVQLARELRAAGIAHGDLQHANVLLVAGKWPGAYTLKLIDYDAMYHPELANAPSYEIGHANYRHPARNERSYSPDLDRFPLLVIATALKGLAVRGPSLWKKYGTDDNMLFTAADFKNPAASPLMGRLWQTDDPALRALVGTLALACLQPISETPWLDEIPATLTAAEEQTVENLFRSGPPADIPVAEAFSLDDEEPAPARPAPLKPIPVMSLDDDDETDEDEPRPRKSRAKPRAPARGFPILPVAIVAAVLLLATGVIAGVLLTRDSKPPEAAQPRAEEPAPPPAPQPQPQPQPEPEPKPGPEPDPRPVPPKELIPVAGPPGFHLAWSKILNDKRAVARPFITADGRTVFVTDNGRIDSFDIKTDRALEFRGPTPTSALHLWVLDGNRVVIFGALHRALVVWDARTGDIRPDPLSRVPFPPLRPGTTTEFVECQISPDGRYVFAGHQGVIRDGGNAPTPYSLVEAETGKVLRQGDWTFGTVQFTADSSRMLMAETNGRVRWVKTANGETEIEWVFEPNRFKQKIGGMSADGSLFIYFGQPPGLPMDHYLIDGKTGQVLRKLGPSYSGDRLTLTPDGRWIVGVVNEPPGRESFAVVTDTRTGEVLARTPLEGTLFDFQFVSFTPDGKAFTHHRFKNHEVVVYELRGTVPQSTAPIPPPLSPIPDRAPPLAAAPVEPQPPFVPPQQGLPAAPVLKAQWTVATETGLPVNQLSLAPLYSKDGKTVILSGGNAGTVLTFDTKTGEAGPVFNHKGAGPGVQWLFPFGADRVASIGFDTKWVTWDTKTGKPVEDLKFPDLPPLPEGQRGHAGITYAVSPSGRYTAAARKEAGRPPGMPAPPGPLRLLDTTTGKELVKAECNGARILFTADESRVFILDGIGKARWYKLPSGEADGEWTTGEGRQAEFARVLGMSADGRAMIFQGPPAGQPMGIYLLDGKTGRTVRNLAGAPYQPSLSTISPDGRYAAVGIIDFARDVTWHVDVFEVATWRLVGRISPPEKNRPEKTVRIPPQFAFTPDSKELGVFYPASKELSLFPIPAK